MLIPSLKLGSCFSFHSESK